MNANFNTSCCTTYHLSRKTNTFMDPLALSIIAVTTFDGRPLLQTTSVKVLYAKQTRFYD